LRQIKNSGLGFGHAVRGHRRLEEQGEQRRHEQRRADASDARRPAKAVKELAEPISPPKK